MITKCLWVEVLHDILDLKALHEIYKEHYVDKKSLEIYLQVLFIIPITPLTVLFDLLISPFEIGYYFFHKWIVKGGKYDRKR